MEKTQRIIDRLEKVIGKSNLLLSEEELNLNELTDIMDDCFLVKEVNGHFKFSFMGKNLIDAFGNQFISKDINNLVLPSNHSINKDFLTVVKTKKPLENSGEFFNDNGIKIKFRKKIYPLADEIGGINVKYIFGGMRWKAEY
jgi:hypothetical protein